MATSWHSKKVDEVLLELDVTHDGLTSQQAQERLMKYGSNELVARKRKTALQMFIGEFKDIFILLLLAATILQGIIGYYEFIQPGGSESALESFADVIVIAAIILMVAITGFVNEYRAEKALEAMKKLTAPKARVVRDGQETIIPAKDIVPGDILVLESGDHVPADARVIEAIELKTIEAILTGESAPINKYAVAVNEQAQISEKRDMLFTATHVVYGRGKAVVTSTGMTTEFGKIAEMVQATEEEETPLQKKLDKFASKIAKVVIGVCVVIFALEAFEVITQAAFSIDGFLTAFTSAIALAISAVPEGLPAIVTVALALGSIEFKRRNALVRKLSSAESLGAVTVICSDKTGTITKGEMTVRQIYADGKFFEVTGVGYEPKGEFRLGETTVKPEPAAELLLKIGALCNNSQLREKDRGGWEIFGDPTEGSMIVAAEKANLSREVLENEFPRIREIPFTSERKRMTTLHKISGDKLVAYVKGAPETILERCTKILENGKEVKLTQEKTNAVLKANEQLASSALRVLAMAYKYLPSSGEKLEDDALETGLIFVGLQGMIDPPRKEAIDANKTCQKAGIKTVMITGDHRLTAVAIAKEVGIFKEGDLELTGVELDKLDDAAFEQEVEKISVYARVSPEHKLRIVSAWKKKGHIVAMTGDGVNDAPAIKAADVGVSMGITGTDVTKEASDLVLTDDNFATIVKAVEEGRVIYDNVRKYARFLIACNFDELLVIGSFALLGGIFGDTIFPLPLLPAMILWINLVTDGAPAVTLATDPPDVDVMDRKPRNPNEGILHGMGRFIVMSFLLQAIGTILVFSLEYYIWPSHQWIINGVVSEPLRILVYEEAITTAFVQAGLFELFVVWNCRSEKRSVWRMGRDAFKNKWFVIAEIVSIAATIGIVYIPITQQLFHLYPLNLTDFAYVAFVASWGLFVLPEITMNKKLWKWG